VKGFVDGSLGAGTAWFHEPYAHDPTSAGGPITDLEELRTGIFEAVEAGLQPAVHAIGDRAVDWLLTVYAEVAEGRPKADLRLRVEHAQHMTPEGIRMADAPHVALSVQPAHLSDDGAGPNPASGPGASVGPSPMVPSIGPGRGWRWGRIGQWRPWTPAVPWRRRWRGRSTRPRGRVPPRGHGPSAPPTNASRCPKP
jgi:predicted amidohydrolase YtcJ